MACGGNKSHKKDLRWLSGEVEASSLLEVSAERRVSGVASSSVSEEVVSFGGDQDHAGKDIIYCSIFGRDAGEHHFKCAASVDACE